MKVVGILGSARENGSTNCLIKEMMKEPAAGGAETKIYNLAKMDIGCCLGCEVCRKTGSCARKDDMRALYDELKTADALIISTPIYMGGMTGQLKTFIDRCFALKDAGRNSLIPAGKKLAVVITQGAPMPDHYIKTADRIEYIFQGFGYIHAGTVIAAGVHNTDELLKEEAVLKKAREIGKQLI
ncbi:MAG: flavodoxin family protein [Methanosarcinales archaeon]|jgi:multimeric flavodoxin WrbA|nr:flavodoxin family protein [Methanosarcinales archaeon]